MLRRIVAESNRTFGKMRAWLGCLIGMPQISSLEEELRSDQLGVPKGVLTSERALLEVNIAPPSSVVGGIGVCLQLPQLLVVEHALVHAHAGWHANGSTTVNLNAFGLCCWRKVAVRHFVQRKVVVGLGDLSIERAFANRSP
eukprot:TRINITY_DN3159_c0_g1_i2.p2 TRINITY_DN3159_c0_g1~~TRINITY_DN3159_c0_g1_i2.p2  ORF type:complete len:142 (+),score=8.00 TRINITY_DN3159_c0_g1_i2:231-656(+)